MGVKLKNSNHQEKPPTMGVLKKVKRRLGLCRSMGGGSGVGGPNNLPPLLFHQVHGDNIRVSWDGRTAKRAESFCKGITFSARPVKIAERVCIRFLEVSNNWSGVLRFGFTNNDPGVLRYSLPKYSCPDLTSKPGYWAKALSERLCEKDAILHYYVTSNGDVHFGINGEEKGVFFSGVDTREPLWTIIDVYGNTTAIQFLDSRWYLNNRRPSQIEQEIVSSIANLSLSPSINPPTPPERNSPPEVRTPQLPPAYDIVPVAYDNEGRTPPLHRSVMPVSLHTTRGKNIRLSSDRRTAWRRESEFCGGYVFMSRPIAIRERVFVEVCSSEPVYLGSLAVGVTSCDPTTLNQSDLPDESDQLLDRAEYWCLAKDLRVRAGETACFCLSPLGELTVTYESSTSPVTLMHVDLSTSLWLFFDLYGSTQKIHMVGVHPPQPLPPPPPPLVSNNRSLVSPSSSSSTPNCSTPVTVTTAAGVGGGTVLVVNLPPPNPPTPQFFPDSATSRCPAMPAPSTPSSDCSVCYERSIDSVLYTCGHMCMCYECAVQQWRGKGGGQCPLCRAVIRDVIRTFRS